MQEIRSLFLHYELFRLKSIFENVKVENTNVLAQDILNAFYGMTEEEQQFYLSMSLSGVSPEELLSIPNPFPVPQPNEIDHYVFNLFCTLPALKFGVFDLLIKTVGHLNGSGITAEEIQEHFRRVLWSDQQILAYKWFGDYVNGIENLYIRMSYPQSEIDKVKKQTGVNDIQAKWIIRQIEILTDYARLYYGPGKQNPASLTMDFETLMKTSFVQCDTRDVTDTDIMNTAISDTRRKPLFMILVSRSFTSDGYIIKDSSLTYVVKWCLPFPFKPSMRNDDYDEYRPIMDPDNYEFSRKPLKYINRMLNKNIPGVKLWARSFNFDGIEICDCSQITPNKKY